MGVKGAEEEEEEEGKGVSSARCRVEFRDKAW